MMVYVTKTEAKMLTDALDELMSNVYSDEDSYEGSSAYSKKDIDAVENIREKLRKAHG